MFTAFIVRFIAFWIKELPMFAKTPLMKRTQGVMVDWFGWLVYWSVVYLGVFCCESILLWSFVVSPPHVTCCCIPEILMVWFDLINPDKWLSGPFDCGVSTCEILSHFDYLLHIVSHFLSCVTHPSFSLELGSVLFEITFSMCICRHDWGSFHFIQPKVIH